MLHHEQKAIQEEATAKTAPRAKAEVEEVKMQDGRTVSFAGKRKMLKTVSIDKEKLTASVQFDFRNGKTLTFTVPDELLLEHAAHGASQKIGDEAAGEDDVDDMAENVENAIGRLQRGEWKVAREPGDSFSGASIVVKAICEVSGKSVDFVKAFLQKKLDDAADKKEKLTRQELYASYRRPGSPTGIVIERMEKEKKQKEPKHKAEDLLAEMETV